VISLWVVWRRGKKRQQFVAAHQSMSAIQRLNWNQFENLVAAAYRQQGYRVTMAGDANDGYMAYLHFRPDLVITDIQMPGRNGFELMEKIRTHDPKMKTIYMSAAAVQFQPLLENEKRWYQSDFLAKPFARAELMSLVSKNLRQRVTPL